MIGSNNFLCAKLASQAASPEKASDKDPKDKLVAQLKTSFEYCETALKGVQDSQLGEPVTLFGGRQAQQGGGADRADQRLGRSLRPGGHCTCA